MIKEDTLEEEISIADEFKPDRDIKEAVKEISLEMEKEVKASVMEEEAKQEALETPVKEEVVETVSEQSNEMEDISEEPSKETEVKEEVEQETLAPVPKKNKTPIIVLLSILLVIDIAALVIYIIGVDKILSFIK